MKEKALFCSWKKEKGMDYMDSCLAQSSYRAVSGLQSCCNFRDHLLHSASSCAMQQKVVNLSYFFPSKETSKDILELKILFESSSFPKNWKTPAGSAGKGPAALRCVDGIKIPKCVLLSFWLSFADASCFWAEAHAPEPKALTFFKFSYCCSENMKDFFVLFWFFYFR